MLYRMRTRHLAALASLLVDAGHTTIVAEPAGMPVLHVGLHVGRRDGRQPRIVASIGYGDVDWFRWVGSDYIAPCGELDEAAEIVCGELRSPPRGSVTGASCLPASGCAYLRGRRRPQLTCGLSPGPEGEEEVDSILQGAK